MWMNQKNKKNTTPDYPKRWSGPQKWAQSDVML